MKLVLTEGQRELRGAVRSFLASVSPLSAVRRAAESGIGHDPEVYRRLNGELGLAGLIIPEEYGGAGAGYAELAVVLEETGAALVPGPFLATALAAILLTEVADKEPLPGIAAGTTVATVALDGDRALDGVEADVILAIDGARVRAVRGQRPYPVDHPGPDPQAGAGGAGPGRGDRLVRRPWPGRDCSRWRWPPSSSECCGPRWTPSWPTPRSG